MAKIKFKFDEVRAAGKRRFWIVGDPGKIEVYTLDRDRWVLLGKNIESYLHACGTVFAYSTTDLGTYASLKAKGELT